MIHEAKQILDIVSSVVADCCFQRKGDMFYRISDNIVYCVALEHPGLYYVRHFIVPLYLPQERIAYTYGKRLHMWWDGKGDGKAFCAQVSSGIKNDILPFFAKIDGPKPLFSFIRQDYKTVSSHFSCPQFRVSLLAAYTALLLHDKKTFSGAVSETRRLLSDTASYTPNVVSKIQRELDDLERIVLLSNLEIDQYYQKQIIQSTHKCFPWHKLQ